MVRNTSEKRDVQGGSGGEHPENSSLLAFLRGQQLEDSECIRLHIMHCTQCQQTYANLSHDSKPLDILSQMSLYLRYPELSAALIPMQIQRGTQKQSRWSSLARRTVSRPRPKKAAVRLVSLPVAFGVGLLCMTVIIVLAYTFAHFVTAPFFPWSSPWGIVNNQPNQASVAQHQPTQVVPATGTPTASVTVSSTPTSTTGPMIVVCSTAADMKNHRLVICGSNFKAKDKVELFEDLPSNKQPVMRSSVTVNSKGTFRDPLSIYFCRNVPLAIVAEDVSGNQAVFSNRLTNITMPNCVDSTSWQGQGP